MIHVNKEDRQFELHTRNMLYACSVDDANRLNFLAWSGKSPSQDGPVFSSRRDFRLHECAAQDPDKPVDEVCGYGDEGAREPAIRLSILGTDNAVHSTEAIRDLRLRYVSYQVGKADVPHAGAPTHGRQTRQTREGDWLMLTLEDASYPLRVVLYMRPDEDADMLERYLVIENRGGRNVVVEHAWAASLTLPVDRYQATHLCGAWIAEFEQQRQVLPVGSTVIESRSLTSGSRHQPVVFFQPAGRAGRSHGVTYAAQLAWSGNWRIQMEQRHDRSMRVHLGENPMDADFVLSPGESQASPLVLATYSRDGEEGAASHFRSYHSRCTLAGAPTRRPVLYNSWEATYFDLSLDGQIALARKAAEIGCELFVVDDGWFGARRSESAGLGDWYVSPDVFPDGLKPLSDAVHDMGMDFGLWFEPEMVNPDSDLYRKHPDWVLHFPDRPRVEARHQLILDFGRPEVVDCIREQMVAVLDAVPVEFIKWDMNRTPNPPGSIAGKRIWRRHVEAVHQLMDYLLKRYPRLQIQSCSSGGGRADAAMLARCCQFWTSDNTDAIERFRIQEGFALAYPTEAMECWVTHEHNHQTGRNHSLSLRFASSMRGVLGVGSSLNELSDQELGEYKKYIELYKRVRHLIHQGKLNRPSLYEVSDGLSAWQYTAEDQRESYLSVVLVTHTPGQTPSHVTLSELEETARYRVQEMLRGDTFEATGAELMHVGFQCAPMLEKHTPSYVGTDYHWLIWAI